MNYTKPEVSGLGKAIQVIEQLNPPKISPLQEAGGTKLTVNPAYDLDE